MDPYGSILYRIPNHFTHVYRAKASESVAPSVIACPPRKHVVHRSSQTRRLSLGALQAYTMKTLRLGAGLSTWSSQNGSAEMGEQWKTRHVNLKTTTSISFRNKSCSQNCSLAHIEASCFEEILAWKFNHINKNNKNQEIQVKKNR